MKSPLGHLIDGLRQDRDYGWNHKLKERIERLVWPEKWAKTEPCGIQVSRSNKRREARERDQKGAGGKLAESAAMRSCGQ